MSNSSLDGLTPSHLFLGHLGPTRTEGPLTQGTPDRGSTYPVSGVVFNDTGEKPLRTPLSPRGTAEGTHNHLHTFTSSPSSATDSPRPPTGPGKIGHAHRPVESKDGPTETGGPFPRTSHHPRPPGQAEQDLRQNIYRSQQNLPQTPVTSEVRKWL